MSSAEHEPTPEEVAQAIFAFAAQLMGQGVSDKDVETQLINKGLGREEALLVIRKLHEAGGYSLKDVGRKNMIYGALWCVGGLIVTIVTYAMAAAEPHGGSYVVAWGAVVFGAIQFIRGMNQVTNKPT
jgi:hypothetical protein